MDNKEKREIVRNVRFSEREWESIKKLANKYDIPVSQILRKAVKNYLKTHY